MSSFNDHKGVEWDFSLTVGKVTKLAKFYRCDPNDVLVKKVGEAMVSGSNIDLCVMFWGLLKDQCSERGISEETFQDQFNTADYEEAEVALRESILDFTRPAQRTAMKATLERAKELQEKAIDQAIQDLNTPEVEQQILEQMRLDFKKALSPRE